MPTLTINIAGSDTPLSNGETSSYGHMWYSIDPVDGVAFPESYGFGPKDNNAKRSNPRFPAARDDL